MSRELALRHKVSLGGERWLEHTKPHPDVQPVIQNQREVGNLAKMLDKTGIIIQNQELDK